MHQALSRHNPRAERGEGGNRGEGPLNPLSPNPARNKQATFNPQHTGARG